VALQKLTSKQAHVPEEDISVIGSMPWQAIPATRAGTEEVKQRIALNCRVLTLLEGHSSTWPREQVLS
jgi:hypothetical protein